YPGEERGGRGLAVRAGDREHPAILEHRAAQPLGAGGVRQAALEQLLDDRHATRHDVADHDHVGGRGELCGLKALGELDAERLELRAHGRVDVAVRARDAKARGTGDGGDAAHEGAADTEDVNVHGSLSHDFSGFSKASTRSPAVRICSSVIPTLAPVVHSSAALTMRLLATICQMTITKAAVRIGSVVGEPSGKCSSSTSASSCRGVSMICTANRPVTVCRVRSGRPTSLSSTAYQTRGNSAVSTPCAARCWRGTSSPASTKRTRYAAIVSASSRDEAGRSWGPRRRSVISVKSLTSSLIIALRTGATLAPCAAAIVQVIAAARLQRIVTT